MTREERDEWQRIYRAHWEMWMLIDPKSADMMARMEADTEIDVQRMAMPR